MGSMSEPQRRRRLDDEAQPVGPVGDGSYAEAYERKVRRMAEELVASGGLRPDSDVLTLPELQRGSDVVTTRSLALIERLVQQKVIGKLSTTLEVSSLQVLGDTVYDVTAVFKVTAKLATEKDTKKSAAPGAQQSFLELAPAVERAGRVASRNTYATVEDMVRERLPGKGRINLEFDRQEEIAGMLWNIKAAVKVTCVPSK